MEHPAVIKLLWYAHPTRTTYFKKPSTLRYPNNQEVKGLLSEEVAQSCPTLCDPMDCSLPGSSVHGIFQARILEWVAISFSSGSSQPRDRTQVSRMVGRCFYCLSHQGSLQEQSGVVTHIRFFAFHKKAKNLPFWFFRKILHILLNTNPQWGLRDEILIKLLYCLK